MGKQHKNDYYSKYRFLLRAAERNPKIICWFCGQRPRIYSRWNLDHIIPDAPNSPIALACSFCNKGRAGIIPDSIQLQRLLYSEDVLRNCRKNELLDILLMWADDKPEGISTTIAAAGEKEKRQYAKNDRRSPKYQGRGWKW